MSTLYQDFAEAQLNFEPIIKNKTVEVRTKTGGTYTFEYADLDEILSKTRVHLNKKGFAVSWTVEQNLMVCRLFHKDGEITSVAEIKGQATSAQEMGALFTYFRRYTYTNLIGISSEDDNDASELQHSFKQTRAQPQQQSMPSVESKPVGLSEAQVRRLWAIAKSKSVSEQLINNHIKLVIGVDSVQHLSFKQYTDLVDKIEKGLLK
jgi:hypothetical protein